MLRLGEGLEMIIIIKQTNNYSKLVEIFSKYNIHFDYI